MLARFFTGNGPEFTETAIVVSFGVMGESLR